MDNPIDWHKKVWGEIKGEKNREIQLHLQRFLVFVILHCQKFM